MWRIPACQTLSKPLDISSALGWVAPELLKSLSVLSDTTSRKRMRRPKTLVEMRKGYISLGDQQWHYLQVFQDSFNHRRKTYRMVVFNIIFYSNILNTGTTNETSEQSGKQGSFRHMLKSSARMYENSGSQFLRTTTSMQSRLNVFYKSRFAMIFFNHLGSYRNILQFLIRSKKKAGKETSKSSTLEFLERELGNNFASWDAEGNTSALLNRGGISDSALLRTL